MQRPEHWKILTIAVAMTGLGVIGAGPAFAESTPPAAPAHSILADDDWDDDWDDDDWDDDDWDDDDWDDDWDDRWDD